MKAGLNYAMSLHARDRSCVAGYDENMFLDPEPEPTWRRPAAQTSCLREQGFGEVVTPQVRFHLLPSITRRL